MKKLLFTSVLVFVSLFGWSQEQGEPVMSDAEMKRLQNLPDSTRLKLEAEDLSHRNPYAAMTTGGHRRTRLQDSIANSQQSNQKKQSPIKYKKTGKKTASKPTSSKTKEKKK